MLPDDPERGGICSRQHILHSSVRTTQDPLLEATVVFAAPNVLQDELQMLVDVQCQKRHHNSTGNMLAWVSQCISVGAKRTVVPEVYAQAVAASGSGCLCAVIG
jgi:hypothetical protein